MVINLITVIVVVASLVTAFLSSIFGMLGGLILMGILVSLMKVGQAMILHGLIQMTSNGYRAWLNRKDINWKIIGTLSIGNILGLVILFFVAFEPDRITVLLALGILPYIAWAMPSNFAFDVTKTPVGILAGIVVVGTNLLAGVGGPILDIFFQRVEMTRHQVVATKAVAQFLGHVSKVIFFGGLVTSASSENWPELWLLITVIGASLVGTTFGKKVLDKINDKTFFSWTQAIMLTVGAVIIIRAIYLINL
jgi:uncharacterized membrane protein YfcA|tara:strand:+ start:141 stop:893 length:753 start_codon:yes stop_codon:yes gene_type:complete